MGAAAAIGAATFLYATQTESGKRVSNKLSGNTPPPDLPIVEQPPTADAVDPKRKKVAAATGRSDTILTGAKGLGEVGSENLQSKTLLGY